MLRKSRQQTKGRSIWITGVTINRLLSRVNELKDRQALLQLSENITDAELAAVVDEVITQFCYQGTAPVPAAIPAPQGFMSYQEPEEEDEPPDLNLDYAIDDI